MAYAPMQWASVNIANGATNSTRIDFGRVYDLIQLDIPALNSCSLSLKVSRTAGGTYNTLGAGSPTVSVGTGSKQEVFVLGGHQFVEIISSVTQNVNRTFYYRGIAT